MNVFMRNVKKYSEFIAMILFFCATGFTLLYYAGSFGGGFTPVMGNLISMILHVALWGVYPLLLILKKRCVAKCAIKAVAFFWALTFLFSLLEDVAGVGVSGYDLGIAAGVFALFVAGALIAAAILMVVSIREKDAMKKRIVFLILCGALFFLLVVFALVTAVSADLSAPWYVYFGILANYLILPCAMFFVLIAYVYTEEELAFFKDRPAPVAPVAAPREEIPAEPVEDTPVEPVEEVPAEPVEDISTEPVEEIPAAPAEEIPAEPVTEETPVPVQEIPAQIEEVPAEPVAAEEPVAPAPEAPVELVAEEIPAEPVAETPAAPVEEPEPFEPIELKLEDDEPEEPAPAEPAPAEAPAEEEAPAAEPMDAQDDDAVWELTLDEDNSDDAK